MSIVLGAARAIAKSEIDVVNVDESKRFKRHVPRKGLTVRKHLPSPSLPFRMNLHRQHNI
jgi:hypothetical protein